MLATPRVRPAGSSKAWTSTSFLLAAAGVQILLFVSFIGFFFTTEQHRQGELSDMQGELQRLRAENARQSKRLIHSNKRMLRYEADIRAEIGAALHPDEEDEEDEEDADGDGDEDAAGAEDGEDGLPAADEHHGDHGVGRGSIAPAAHIEPVAAARVRSASEEHGTPRETHGHPLLSSMPSASANAAAAASMPAVLRGQCASLTHDWWTYEVCFGRRVRQYHAISGVDEEDSHSLGAYVRGTDPRLQRYRGGDACAVGAAARSAEVKVECANADGADMLTLISVDEPHTCHYLLTVHVPPSNCAEIGAEPKGDASGAGHGSSGGSSATGGGASSPGNGAPTESRNQIHAASSMYAAAGAAVGAAAGTPARTSAGAAAGIPPFDSSARELSLSELQALSASGDSAVASKRLAIVHALRHAWRGYEKHSFGQDEVRPISGKSNNWIGLGLTIVDSLDTLWLAGMHDEFEEVLRELRPREGTFPIGGKITARLFIGPRRGN